MEKEFLNKSVYYSCLSKLCASLMWKRWNVHISWNRTIQQYWFNGGFMWIMLKKRLWEHSVTCGISHLLKLDAFVLRIIQAHDHDETVKHIPTSYLCSPVKSVRTASRELGDVSLMTVCRVLCKILSFCPYIFQILQELKHNDWPYWRGFCTNTASKRIVRFWTKLFSVTRLPFTYWGRWIAIIYHLGITDSTPICRTCVRQTQGECFAVSTTQVYGPFSFVDATIMGLVYLNMLEHFLVPQPRFGNKMGSSLSQACDAVPDLDIPSKMYRLWCLHCVATQFTWSDIHWISLLGFVKENVYMHIPHG
jgi:hypothetical protein